MSALQTLRTKAGLFVSIAIGLALVAFILGDFLNSNKSSAKDSIVAEINGKKIDVNEYFALVNQLEEDYKSRSGGSVDDNTRNYLYRQAWDQIVREALMSEQFELLGLGVEVPEHGIIGITPEELKDIVMGNNVDPQIQQIFTNPKTGTYDRDLAVNFLQNMDKDPERKAIWLNIEKTLMQNQLASKYNALITKGLYVTAKEAAYSATEKNQNFSVQFAGFGYNSVEDSTVKLTDADYEKYYNENLAKFKTEAVADIDYVTFPIQPSQEDYATTQKWVADMLPAFKASEDDQLYVSSNSDVPYADKMYSKKDMPKGIDSSFYFAQEGSVFGPYFEQGYFKLAKLSKRSAASDSVKARHILIKTGDAPKIADSLKALIKGGADFAEIAKQKSEDQGSAEKGGDLGWFTYGSMVKEFNDTCFNGKPGVIYTVNTRFGVHLIEILEKSKPSEKVSLAIIASEVKPSSGTINKIYGIAGKFAADNSTKALFDTAVAKNPGLVKRSATNVKESDRMIPGLPSARPVVRWAYESEKGAISNVFEVDGQFIVAQLVSKLEKGTKPLDAVKEAIKYDVMNEKKAEMFIAKINAAGGTSVADIAAKTSAPVNTTTEITASSMSVPGLGAEPAFIGTAAGIKIGTVSKPIKGSSGVYVLSVLNMTERPASTPESEKSALAQIYSQAFSYQLIDALKDKVEIKDNRSKFE